MSNLVQADIFFFITSISVAVLTILLIILSVYAWKILANVRHLTNRARVEGDFVFDEVKRLREKLKENRINIMAMFVFLRHLIKRYKFKNRQ